MKTLYLVRHAKSSWSFPDLDDFDRPLGKRGRKDVSKIGGMIKKSKTPDLIITSAASRALLTALFLADAWDYDEEKIVISEKLYHADPRVFHALLSGLTHDSVALVGHNPGLTMFNNQVSSQIIENIPTCGIVALTFECDHWKDITDDKGTMKYFNRPKKKLI